MMVTRPEIRRQLLANNTLVIASHNAGKVNEIHTLLQPLHINVISAAHANVEEPEETGTTFEANAVLKAEHCMHVTGFASLADDSGLVVPAIGGAPGIYSARWAGPNKDFASAFERIRTELGDKPANAYFICVLSLALPDGTTHSFEGRIDGQLTFPPRGDKGFGYDPIFIAENNDVTFGELDPNIKNNISHRARAFAKFLAFLQESA
jgi:XTP/dITP diphosphohydrolase